jgi:hypothetical protein
MTRLLTWLCVLCAFCFAVGCCLTLGGCTGRTPFNGCYTPVAPAVEALVKYCATNKPPTCRPPDLPLAERMAAVRVKPTNFTVYAAFTFADASTLAQVAWWTAGGATNYGDWVATNVVPVKLTAGAPRYWVSARACREFQSKTDWCPPVTFSGWETRTFCLLGTGTVYKSSSVCGDWALWSLNGLAVVYTATNAPEGTAFYRGTNVWSDTYVRALP